MYYVAAIGGCCLLLDLFDTNKRFITVNQLDEKPFCRASSFHFLKTQISARILVRYLLLAVLVFTVFINLTFILETSKSGYRRFGVGSSDEVGRRAMNDNDDDDDDDDEDEDDDDVGGGGGVVGGSGRFIDVRATSSKDSIEITAAGVKIVNDTKNRGIHVAVLHQVLHGAMF